MFIFRNFILAVANVIDIVLTLFMWLIVIRALISWVSPDPFNPIVQFLYRVTDSVLEPVRRRLPFLGGVDISPMIILLVIIFLQSFLVVTLRRIGYSMQNSQSAESMPYFDEAVPPAKMTKDKRVY